MSGLRELITLRSRDARDFASLSASCNGAWPALVFDILRDIGDEPCRRLLATASRQAPKIVSDPRLPLAHPLDADWRFTRESARSVLDHALEATPENGTLLLVAMPTVALAAFDGGLGHRIAVAARNGDATDKALRAAMPGVHFQDLANTSSRAFDVVAIDPPWYDAIAMPMIKAASDAAKPGAAIFVCVPDVHTLPSMAPKLSALAQGPRAIGFKDGVVMGAVRYATPFFELRCLQEHGITNIDPAWRTGILIRCRTGQGPLKAETDPRLRQPSDSAGWIETTYGAIRLWLRPDPAASDAARIAIARSVSASDPLRTTAWLWTSGNLTVTGGHASAIQDGVKSDDFFGRIAERRFRDELLTALVAEAAAIEESVRPYIG